MNAQILHQGRDISSVTKIFMAMALIALAALLPVFAKGFVLFQATQIMIFAIAILGLNLLVGFS
jgi:branched-chain amino acid transport system permease protein